MKTNPFSWSTGPIERPSLGERLIRAAKEARAMIEKMSPDELREMQDAQRKSWVVGELMLEHPEMTKAEAEGIYEKVSILDRAPNDAGGDG